MSGIDCEDLLDLRREDGGARRDRTDDLKLAKLALSQLSYGPIGNQGFDRTDAGRPGQI